MPKRRQLVFLRFADPEDRSKGTKTLAPRKEFAQTLAGFNTATDGSPPGATERFYGPGIIVEIAASGKDVNQALINCVEPDIAWPVLSRICKASGWKMQDVESGQVFG